MASLGSTRPTYLIVVGLGSGLGTVPSKLDLLVLDSYDFPYSGAQVPIAQACRFDCYVRMHLPRIPTKGMLRTSSLGCFSVSISNSLAFQQQTLAWPNYLVFQAQTVSPSSLRIYM